MGWGLGIRSMSNLNLSLDQGPKSQYIRPTLTDVQNKSHVWSNLGNGIRNVILKGDRWLLRNGSGRTDGSMTTRLRTKSPLKFR
ncbi:hypothetical protein V2J09_010277 [Rumex salicifolius]